MLIDFLSSFLNKNITKIEVKKDISLGRSSVIEKFGVLDLSAVIDGKEIVNIEMQVIDQKNLMDRLTYYSSKSISSQLIKGEEYSKLKKVIAIAITDFIQFDVEDYISETILVLKKNKEYEIDYLMKFYVIELPKFRKIRPDLNNVFQQWLTYIDRKSIEGVKQAMQNNKKIEKAEEELQYLTGSEEVRRIAELREKYLKDTNSIKLDAREEGKKEGIKLGKIEIIKNLVKLNMPIENIAEAVEMSVDEIKDLIK